MTILNPSDVTSDMLLAYIQSALRSIDTAHPIYQITKELSLLNQTSSSAKLISWISAIAQSIDCIDRLEHAKFVHFLFTLDRLFLAEDSVLCSTFIHLLKNLVSAHPYFAKAVLEELVALFLKHPVACTPSHSNVTPNAYYTRVHEAIQAVLLIHRGGPAILMPCLVTQYPHNSRPLADLQAYLHNLLRILVYVPVLQEQIWTLIVGQLVQLDVELQVDVEDLESDPNDTQFIFEMDGEYPGSQDSGQMLASPVPVSSKSGFCDDAEDEVYDTEPATQCTGPSAQAHMSKLDHLMHLMFTYIESPAFTLHHRQESQFGMVLGIFEQLVMPTYKSKHAQFLVFYMASQNPALCVDLLLGMLVGRLMDVNQGAVVRSHAAMYMASFIARAAYLPKPYVLQCFAYLVQHCVAFVEQNEANVTHVDIAKYLVFYSVVQAVLYVYCFHWRHLVLELPMGGLQGFEVVVLSRFNPLKVISPTIVREFARITHEQNSVYCYAIIQRNKRLYMPSSVPYSVGSDDAMRTTLDDYFPFDPYLLPMSSVFIDPLYTAWQSSEPISIQINDQVRESTFAGTSAPNSFTDTCCASSVNNKEMLAISPSAENCLMSQLGLIYN